LVIPRLARYLPRTIKHHANAGCSNRMAQLNQAAKSIERQAPVARNTIFL
jgi:hypothetical protein